MSDDCRPADVRGRGYARASERQATEHARLQIALVEVSATHELSITQSVVDAVNERVGGQRVVSVRLEVGRLCGVVPDAMRFCFELVTEQTALEGARLDIDEPPGQAHCGTCDQDFALIDPIPLCPCGSADVAITAGRELVIKSVEVA